MELHLEQLTKEKMAGGLTASEAQTAARREMGNLGLFEEQSRDARRVRYLHDLADDLRFAVRLLRKAPAFTAVSVLSLGLGIGANTAIFTLIKRSYLEALPVPAPDRLAILERANAEQPRARGSSFSYPLFRELAAARSPFEGLLCQSSSRATLVAGDGAAAESILIELVSGTYHQVFGVKPHIGRLLTPDDNRKAASHPVVVLSYNYWRRRFASDPSIVGQLVRINTYPVTVIGVTPPGFDGLTKGWSPDVAVPLVMETEILQRPSSLERPGSSWLTVAGRLRAGVTERQAEAALTPVMRAHYAARGREAGRVVVRPMVTGWRSVATDANATALLGITGIVLLAACMNLANLLLARASARRNEISMRMALGAGRLRVIRQMLTESMLLAALGAALGFVLAVVSGPFILKMAKGAEPQLTQSAAPDLTILLFNLAVATGCGLLFGLAPALHSVRARSSRTVAGGRLRGRKLLLSAQIALTLLLLAGAGLFIRTLSNMRATDLGFAPEHLIQLTPMARNAGYSEAQVLPYFNRVVERLKGLPGVRGASFSVQRVMTNSGWSSGIRVEGMTVKAGDSAPNRDAVGTGYFSTLGIPILAGREFNERDSEKAPKVAIVNEAFAKYYFGDTNPLGRRIDQDGDGPLGYTIVGVAKSGKYRNVRDETTRFWYAPLEQLNAPNMRSFITVYVRTAGDPAHVLADVRRAIAAIDPNVALTGVKTVEAQIAEGQRFERMIATLAAFFGGLAAVLAAIGLYGILSYLVNQRQRELGIRLALGASPLGVARLVVSSVAGWTGLGILLSLPAIYYGSRAVKDILYGVEPLDPAALAWAAGTLIAVSILAAGLPARRAAGVSPSIALRSE